MLDLKEMKLKLIWNLRWWHKQSKSKDVPCNNVKAKAVIVVVESISVEYISHENIIYYEWFKCWITNIMEMPKPYISLDVKFLLPLIFCQKDFYFLPKSFCPSASSSRIARVQWNLLKETNFLTIKFSYISLFPFLDNFSAKIVMS